MNLRISNQGHEQIVTQFKVGHVREATTAALKVLELTDENAKVRLEELFSDNLSKNYRRKIAPLVAIASYGLTKKRAVVAEAAFNALPSHPITFQATVCAVDMNAETIRSLSTTSKSNAAVSKVAHVLYAHDRFLGARQSELAMGFSADSSPTFKVLLGEIQIFAALINSKMAVNPDAMKLVGEHLGKYFGRVATSLKIGLDSRAVSSALPNFSRAIISANSGLFGRERAALEEQALNFLKSLKEYVGPENSKMADDISTGIAGFKSLH